MHRIWVVGTSGSGKTTVARALAARLEIKHIELDELFWLPNWQQPDRAEFAARAVDALAGEEWVADGNYGSIGETVLSRADTVVWLDLPFRLVLWRTTRRAIRRLLTREPMWSAGNRESLRKLLSRDSILWWTVTSHRRLRRRYVDWLVARKPAKRVVRLRSSDEVSRWLESVPAR